jgi:hypothetical protein
MHLTEFDFRYNARSGVGISDPQRAGGNLPAWLRRNDRGGEARPHHRSRAAALALAFPPPALGERRHRVLTRPWTV